VSAQSLDVGGIEIRLGQDVGEAFKSLAQYQVVRLSDSWAVMEKVGASSRLLGIITAQGNRIDFVSKAFELESDADGPEVLTRAVKELRIRATADCNTSATNGGYTGDLVSGFVIRCGRLAARYLMPSRISGVETPGAVALELGARQK
jgi:hypothetical protein